MAKKLLLAFLLFTFSFYIIGCASIRPQETPAQTTQTSEQKTAQTTESNADSISDQISETSGLNKEVSSEELDNITNELDSLNW